MARIWQFLDLLMILLSSGHTEKWWKIQIPDVFSLLITGKYAIFPWNVNIKRKKTVQTWWVRSYDRIIDVVCKIVSDWWWSYLCSCPAHDDRHIETSFLWTSGPPALMRLNGWCSVASIRSTIHLVILLIIGNKRWKRIKLYYLTNIIPNFWFPKQTYKFSYCAIFAICDRLKGNCIILVYASWNINWEGSLSIKESL